MCDYSTESFRSREAKVGDKLAVSRLIHGFMDTKTVETIEQMTRRRGWTSSDLSKAICMTCLKEVGTILRLADGDYAYRQRDVRHDYRDVLINVETGEMRLIASLRAGTTAEVISIPSQTQTLEQKLGVDKINAQITQAADPAGVPNTADQRGVIARVLDRVRGH